MPAIKRRPGLWCSLVFLRPPRQDLSFAEMALLSLVFFWVDAGSVLISAECLFWPEEVPVWAREQRPPVCPHLAAYVAGPLPSFCSTYSSLLEKIWRRLIRSSTSMGGRNCCGCGCGCGRCNGCANNRSRSVDSRNRGLDSRNRCENSRNRYYDRDLEVSPYRESSVALGFLFCLRYLFESVQMWSLCVGASIYSWCGWLNVLVFHLSISRSVQHLFFSLFSAPLFPLPCVSFSSNWLWFS